MLIIFSAQVHVKFGWQDRKFEQRCSLSFDPAWEGVINMKLEAKKGRKSIDEMGDEKIYEGQESDEPVCPAD